MSANLTIRHQKQHNKNVHENARTQLGHGDGLGGGGAGHGGVADQRRPGRPPWAAISAQDLPRLAAAASAPPRPPPAASARLRSPAPGRGFGARERPARPARPTAARPACSSRRARVRVTISAAADRRGDRPVRRKLGSRARRGTGTRHHGVPEPRDHTVAATLGTSCWQLQATTPAPASSLPRPPGSRMQGTGRLPARLPLPGRVRRFQVWITG